MGIEIERKFLVNRKEFEASTQILGVFDTSKMIIQGYLFVSDEAVLRVRWTSSAQEGSRGFVTLKGPGKMKRSEFEMEVDSTLAAHLLHSCERVIEKKRYRLGRWEVDDFINVVDPADTRRHLLMAEIELSREDEEFARPLWLGLEVTPDPRYANSNLVKMITGTERSVRHDNALHPSVDPNSNTGR
jgi:CYTH domain-containing protein